MCVWVRASVCVCLRPMHMSKVQSTKALLLDKSKRVDWCVCRGAKLPFAGTPFQLATTGIKVTTDVLCPILAHCEIQLVDVAVGQILGNHNIGW